MAGMGLDDRNSDLWTPPQAMRLVSLYSAVEALPFILVIEG
jgi:hypothetical protein